MGIKDILNNKKLLLKMIVSLVVVLIIAMGSILLIDREKNEKLSIEDFKEMAKEYYENKYNMELQINDIGYISTGGLVSNETNDMYIKVSNGSTIIYIEETKKLYDNRQAKEIINNIEETVLENVFANVSSITNIEEIFYNNVKVNEFNIFTKQGIKGSYFNSYYDGDIEKFLANEEVVFDDLRLFAICDDSSKTESIKNKVIDELQKSNIKYEESNIELRILTRDCYDKYLNKEYRLPDIDMTECYAKYVLGEKEYSYVQKYIEVTDGIFITSNERDFLLETNDIVLEKCETDKIAMYKVKFSERIKEYINSKTYNELNVYVRYDLEKVDYNKLNEKGEEIKEENVEDIKLYYNRKKDENKILNLFSEMSDGEYAVLEDGDYIFFEIDKKSED
ncbi:MAG: hypothetical protein IJA34_15895 [Lachnospiraceae bacterium]|nr:hypothetical protein [Lachnospiraceae bacterium]